MRKSKKIKALENRIKRLEIEFITLKVKSRLDLEQKMNEFDRSLNRNKVNPFKNPSVYYEKSQPRWKK